MGKPAINPPRRERSGRKQRATTQEKLNELARTDRLKIVGTVTAQPHRRGANDPESPLLGCAIGRFVARHRMAVEIVDAAQHYAEAKRCWLSVKGAPLETRLGGSGGDVEPDVVQKWLETFRGIERAVAGVSGMNALSLIQGAALREMDIPENDHVPAVKLGLVELGYVTGRLVRPK